MKTFNNKLFWIATILFIFGCKGDLLDTVPYSQIASGTMWNSEDLADLGVNGVYNTLRFDYVGLNRWYFDGDASTVAMHRGQQSLTAGNINSANSLFSDYWAQNYTGIHRANDAILNLAERAPLSPEKRGRLLAEVKFLRAYFYFNLNMVFKGVPVYLEPVEVEEANRARETEAKVWQVIISDLTDAINEPNLPNMYAKGNANVGRATKAAAYALRGKAYLWMKDYANAEADLRKVGELGVTLYQGDYRMLFKEANEQHSEMIFSVQNLGMVDFGSITQLYLGNRNSFASGWNRYLAQVDFVDSFENADGTPFNWDDYLPGYNSMTPRQRAVFFLRDNLTAAEITTFTNRGADMSKYLPDGNEARIKLAYDNRDPRLKASIITPYSDYFGVVGIVEATFTLRWPYRSDQAPVRDLRTDTNSLFYYLWRKWVYEGASETPHHRYGPIDQPLIRFADVVLMLAEAINEQRGGNQEAIDLVNSIRQRAGMPGLQNVTGQADLRDRIRNERRWELALEGIIFFDELRWGTWKDNFYEGAGARQIWGENQYNYYWAGDYITTWPIPRVEIERNSNLTQNPGWID